MAGIWWTEEEKEILVKLYNKGILVEEMRTVLKSRTTTALENKINSLVQAGLLEKRTPKPEIDYDALDDMLENLMKLESI